MRKRSAVYYEREAIIESLVAEHKDPATAGNRKIEIEKDLFERFYKVANKIAGQYRNNPVSVEDMALSAMEGFRKSLDRYSPDHGGGMKFLGYAATGMKHAVIHTVREHYGIKSNWQKHLFSNERKYRAEVLEKHPGLKEEDVDILIAKRLYQVALDKGTGAQLHIHSQEQALERLHSYKDMMRTATRVYYADSTVQYNDDGDEVSLVETIPADNIPPVEDFVGAREEASHIRGLLKHAFSKLNEREQYVFSSRIMAQAGTDGGRSKTLEELSGELDISRERVRQIFVRAHEKVQKALIVEARRNKLSHMAGIDFREVAMPEQDGKKSLYSRSKNAKSSEAAINEPEFS